MYKGEGRKSLSIDGERKLGAAKRICENEAFRKKAGNLYRQRKIDVEPVFGFLKANLGFTRFSVRGKSKVENEMGLALMAVNLRKYVLRA